MLSPETAINGVSIWDGVGRSAFEKNVANLLHENPVPGSARVYNIETFVSGYDRSRSSDSIPIDIERQVADDFAFVAACEEGVNTVTATTIELLPFGLRMVMAANKGIQRRVDVALKEIFVALEACAQRRLSRDACATEIFDSVTRLNRNRIYGRLGSRKYAKPHHRYGSTTKPLPTELQGLITRKHSSASSNPTEQKKIVAELDSFHDAFRRMETLSMSTDLEAMKVVLKQAYQITIDGTSLVTRLQRLGLPSETTDLKQVKQLMKLANYWRICDAMTNIARSFRNYFSRIELKTLEPYRPSEWRGEKRFIHAEIQLVIYYEINDHLRKPRVIGASKEACFLCDSFVRAHATFCLSRAHQRLFEKWTVPDLKEYSVKSRTRMQSALQEVNRDVMDEQSRAKESSFRRLFPLQSSINLTKASVRDPSVSTIRSRKHEHAAHISGSNSVIAEGRKFDGSVMMSRCSTPAEKLRITASEVDCTVQAKTEGQEWHGEGASCSSLLDKDLDSPVQREPVVGDQQLSVEADAFDSTRQSHPREAVVRAASKKGHPENAASQLFPSRQRCRDQLASEEDLMLRARRRHIRRHHHRDGNSRVVFLKMPLPVRRTDTQTRRAFHTSKPRYFVRQRRRRRPVTPSPKGNRQKSSCMLWRALSRFVRMLRKVNSESRYVAEKVTYRTTLRKRNFSPTLGKGEAQR